MNPREVVQAAFRFQATPEVPYWITFGGDVDNRLREHYGDPQWARRLVPYISGGHFGFRMDPVGDGGDGTYRDPFGTIFQQGNILHVVKPALDRPSLAGYRWPDMATLEDWDALAGYTAAEPGSFQLRGLAFGLFERAWLMRGFENLLSDLYEHPEFVHDLLDGIQQIHFQAMETATSRMKLDAWFGGDDFCDQRGVIMGPPLWRKFFKDRQAQLIERCHRLSLPTVMHSCGNLMPLVDELMEIGLDGLESLQPEAMNVYELRRRTEGRMVLIGGLGVQRLMPFGTPAEVTAEVRRLMVEMTRRGGYVLAPAKPLQDDTTTANAAALMDAATEGKESSGPSRK